jgi:broad specificity phosphatase PhoE
VSAEPSAGHVVLVRHGETEWTLSGQHTGRTDIPLTARGRREAQRLATRFAGHRFALVLSSPMSRALDTCRLAGLGEHVVVTDDLHEWDYGEYEGLRTADIRRERPQWLLWRDGAPNGETAEDVATRVDRVIDRARDAGGDVAVFAHGQVLRVLAARWVGEEPAAGAHYALSPASLSVLAWEREVPVIARWNDTGERDGGWLFA